MLCLELKLSTLGIAVFTTGDLLIRDPHSLMMR